MGVVPRRFFCTPCKKMRWPGDCEHARVEAHPALAGLSYPPRLSELCPRCAKTPDDCQCHGKAKEARMRARGEELSAHVLALTGCPCVHHMSAYVADDVTKTITCGPCCGKPKAVLEPSPQLLSAAGRSWMSSSSLAEVIAYSKEKYPDRELLYDKNALGWISNGHFLVFAGREAAAIIAQNPSRECSLAKLIAHWEAAGKGVQLFWNAVKCEPRDNPVSMIGWGARGWTYDKTIPVSVIQPGYVNVLYAGPAVHREAGRDDDVQAAILSWDGDKVCAAVMPYLETPIR